MPATAVPVIERIRHWLARTTAEPATDAELVRRFAAGRDEPAFAALVDRHGPMVLGVARRVLGDHHAAEDVFQATFLTLARRASRLRRSGALAAWLHRTARNFAVSACRARGRRDRAEARAPARTSGNPLDDLSSRELVVILDEELQRLPDVFRLPLVLCCLEGRSYDEAARLLGWSAGSVKGRLERGRLRLRSRLAGRGLTFAVAAGVPLLAVPPAIAASLRQETLRAIYAADLIRPEVAVLAAGFRQPVTFSGWKTLLVVVAAVSLVGGGWLTWSGRADESAEAGPDPELEVFTGAPAARNAAVTGEGLPQGALARLGSPRLRMGHSAFALAADGKAIFAVSPEGTVRRFDAQTGRLLESRPLSDRRDVDPSGQGKASISDDARTVALREKVSRGNRITVWDVASGELLCRRSAAAGVTLSGFALSPDGTLLAVDERTDGLKAKQTLHVYDTKTGAGKAVGDLEVNVYHIRFMGNTRRVLVSEISASEPRFAGLSCFDVSAGKRLWRVPMQLSEFAASPDGKTVVAASYGQREFHVIEVDPETGKATESTRPAKHAHPNMPLLIAPDNRTVVIGFFDGIRTWDLQTGDETLRCPRPKQNFASGNHLGALSPDAKSLFTNFGYLQRWDLTAGESKFDDPPDDGLRSAIACLAFSRDGKQLFGAGAIEAACWDAATGERLAYTWNQTGHRVFATPRGFRSLSWVQYRNRDRIQLQDATSGGVLREVHWAEEKEISSLFCYDLTADGKTLNVAWTKRGEERKLRIRSFDAASGTQTAEHVYPANSPCPRSPFSPCGRWAVVGGKVYHLPTGTELFTPTGDADERLKPGVFWKETGLNWFSDDGRLLAGPLAREGFARTETLAVWDLASGKIVARIPDAEFVRQVSFSPDGRTVALVDGRGVRVRDLLTGSALAEYATPDVVCGLVNAVFASQTTVFSPDGRTLATGHADGTVLLWKVPQLAPEASNATDVERRWADLASESPATAGTAVNWLAGHPTEAMALLRARFRAEPLPPDPAVVALIKNLDSDTFATREEATRKLVEQGPKVEKPLRRLLAGTPSAEARRRVEEILPRLTAPLQRLPLSGETLRGVRAIEVLERIHTTEARKLLEAWCEPGRDTRLNAEAEAALARFGLAK
jgi:RNA polymerase sigma factor (sigma-70 family)